MTTKGRKRIGGRAPSRPPVWLTIYGVTAEQWTARYGVAAFTYPCSRCGRPLATTIPFAEGELCGLRAPTCTCGNKSTPYAFVRDPKYGDLFSNR